MTEDPKKLLAEHESTFSALYEWAVRIQESEVKPETIANFLTTYQAWLEVGRRIAERNHHVCLMDLLAVRAALDNPKHLDWCLWEARQIARAVRTGVAAGAQVTKRIDEAYPEDQRG